MRQARAIHVDHAKLRAAGIDPAHLFYAARILMGDAEMPADPDPELTKTINYLKELEVAQKSDDKKPAKGRKALPPAEAVGPQFVSATPPELAEKERQMVVARDAQEATVRAVAAQLGYQLPAEATDPDLIQRDIAANMRRSVEACLEVGRGLMVLKAACEHGQFGQRLDALGLEASVAQRFMQASAKFSNAATSQHLLKAIGTQSKLLEMLVLDDEQIDELALTGQTGELHLDDVATMSVKELRAALRAARETDAAKDRLIADKNAKLDQLATRKGRVKTEPPDEVLAGMRHELSGFAHGVEAALAGELLPGIRAINDHHDVHGGDSREFVEGVLRQVERMVATVRAECGMPGGLAPME